MSAEEPRPWGVIDIDGVVADVRHRLHHLARRPKNWEAFFAAAPQDDLLAEGAAAAAELALSCDIVWMSGRPEKCRRDTEQWLAAHDLPRGPVLLRRAREFRPATEIKLARLRELARQRPVAMLIDDDAAVCAAAEAAGFPVWRATWMTDETSAPTLFDAQQEDGQT